MSNKNKVDWLALGGLYGLAILTVYLVMGGL